MCPVGNKCFKVVHARAHGFGKNRTTWAGALEICRRGPGYLPDLASVTSEADNGKKASVRETTLINACPLVASLVAVVDDNSGENQMKWSRVGLLLTVTHNGDIVYTSRDQFIIIMQCRTI